MLTTIKTFRDPWEAHLFRMRLEADNIPAFVVNDEHVWMKWTISTALGGVRVQVPDFFVEPAGVVLARCASGACRAELAEMFGDIDELVCPRCGSRDIRRRPFLSEFIFGIAIIVLGVAVKFETKACTCRNCGKRWTDRRYD
jgi:hypothetical protein